MQVPTQFRSPFRESELAPVEEEKVRPIQEGMGPYIVTGDSVMRPSDLDPTTALLTALTLMYGELQIPMEHLGLMPMRSFDRGTHPLTAPRSLQREMLQVVRKQGQGLTLWMRLYGIISILLLILALLSSVAMAMFFRPEWTWLVAFWKGLAASTPIWVVAVFSLGYLAQKLGSYGWRRCLRLLLEACFQSLSHSSSNERDRSRGDSTELRRQR